MTYLFEFHRRASTWSWMIYPRERKYLWDYPFALVRISTKMNSLYQIRSKMLHGTKVIILVGKKIEKEVIWMGYELTTFTIEVQSAIHYTMDPS